MINVQSQINIIKRQILVPDEDEPILIDMYAYYSALACGICNRDADQITDVMHGIISDAVMAAYNQRGGEGMTDSSVGGQSYNYKDVVDDMRKKLLATGQHVCHPKVNLSSTLGRHSVVIGNPLIPSPGFPPPHAVPATFAAHGVPSI